MHLLPSNVSITMPMITYIWSVIRIWSNMVCTSVRRCYMVSMWWSMFIKIPRNWPISIHPRWRQWSMIPMKIIPIIVIERIIITIAVYII